MYSRFCAGPRTTQTSLTWPRGPSRSIRHDLQANSRPMSAVFTAQSMCVALPVLRSWTLRKRVGASLLLILQPSPMRRNCARSLPRALSSKTMGYAVCGACRRWENSGAGADIGGKLSFLSDAAARARRERDGVLAGMSVRRARTPVAGCPHAALRRTCYQTACNHPHVRAQLDPHSPLARSARLRILLVVLACSTLLAFSAALSRSCLSCTALRRFRYATDHRWPLRRH